MPGSGTGIRDDLVDLDAWWRAANYLAAGQIYLLDNPLLTEKLRPEHIKQRLIGHWGTVPGVTLTYAHLNRAIMRTGQEMLFVLGPGHGAAALNAATWLEGTYSMRHPEVRQDLAGMRELFRQFSFPGGVPSHASPHLPGSIHEGGELGYSLAHATGAAFDNPNLLVACTIGDGEAETAALSASWHGSLFLDRVTDGSVLPILHLNGYKIASPTLLARMSREELDAMLSAQGWEPMYVEGADAAEVHECFADVLDAAMERIRGIRDDAECGLGPRDPCRPMIVLATPKGWTGPMLVDGERVEGTFRSHQVPLPEVRENPEHLAQLEDWLRSYRPEELFDDAGRPVDRIARLHPEHLRMSANRATHGHDSVDLRLPSPADHSVGFAAPGTELAEATRVLGGYLRDALVENPRNLLFFSPDEHTSNRLDAVLEVTGRRWRGRRIAGDDRLSPDGRVLEVLSEHLCQGWLEGYLLTGRHGVFSTYEAFAHIVDSMVVQHAKWLHMAAEYPWREPIPSLNYLITSHVWRQDHNGASHQDPGFIDHVLSKRPEVSRVDLPPDANCLLHVFDHCLRSRGRVNVVVAGKQPALQYLDDDAARVHCERGLSAWRWAGSDTDRPAEVVLACAGDVPTQETLAAAMLLRELVPDLAVRVVNVVDLARLFPPDRHPHGIGDDEYRDIFTDAPVIFAFHGYPWLIHRIAYRRPGHDAMHVHGFTDNGTTTTPFSMCAMNGIDRFTLAAAALTEVPRVRDRLERFTADLTARREAAEAYARRYGIDTPEIIDWRWGGGDSR
ncbi:phosphoketolase family protein [Nocardia seriolae]|uniref:phosphoketolase family protein n=2 Tax=Nocardia seriolae TaxID=37332 RepID=UPI0009094F24|nr:phosphoketolase family protein [Nocardia seriolae]MTJ88360.1 phosphoketolase [Nocardia seriolae]MTK41686.1 phosphoketolase [Nocardia seriolae]MTK48930.1 phosphoketolase [Nocardia seriolae]BAW07313.1 phosphoketolase [Nocardia seriolae]